MHEVQVEVYAAQGGELGFRFVDADLSKRPVSVESLTTGIAEGEIWWATIMNTLPQKSKRKDTAVIRLLRKLEKPKLDLLTELEGFWIEPMVLRHIQIILLQGRGILLIGTHGTGKTDFGYRLSKAWGCQFIKVDCGSLQIPSALFGSEAAEAGATVWRESQFSLFCKQAKEDPEQKFLVLLDEINRMHARTAESLHGLFDHTRQVSFTTTKGTWVVTIPPNIMTVATRNSGEKFTGTYRMDAALSGRFTPIHMHHMPAEAEQEKLIKAHGIHPRQAELIVQVATSLRQAERNGLLPDSPSPRHTDVAALLVKYGETVSDAVETAFMGMYDRVGPETNGNGHENTDTEYFQAKSHVRKFLKEATANV